MVSSYFNGTSIIDKKINQILKNSSQFKNVFFDNDSFKQEQIQNLANAIKVNTHLEYINLAGCNFSGEDLRVLASAFELNNSIKEVVINNYTKASPEYKKNLNIILSQVQKNVSASESAPYHGCK